MSKPLEITWMIDSSGTETAHRNGPDLTMRDSYLGALVFKRDERNWYCVVGGELDKFDGEWLGPFGMNSNNARTELVKRLLENS